MPQVLESGEFCCSFLPPSHPRHLSSCLYSDRATRNHRSLWEDTSPYGTGEREGMCSFRVCIGTYPVTVVTVTGGRYNLLSVCKKHSLFCTWDFSHCGDSPEDKHLDKYNQHNRSVWARAEKKQAFFSLHRRSSSSSFGLRQLRSTASPLPALTDPACHFLFESLPPYVLCPSTLCPAEHQGKFFTHC